MIKKATIEVEQFDNGITARWEDSDGNYNSNKSLASNGREAECIGKHLWADIKEILSNPTDKVIVKIEYVIPE